jgi:hypothetical protein
MRAGVRRHPMRVPLVARRVRRRPKAFTARPDEHALILALGAADLSASAL